MTDKIEVEKLAVMKERENRDLDTLVDENTLVAGETGAGVFGVFKFFQGIRNFFKGIQALGTLVTTSKIPVTDADGNVTYTTPQAIVDAVSEVNGVKDFKDGVTVDGETVSLSSDLEDYDTSSEVTQKISDSLTDYPTNSQTDTKINNALANYHKTISFPNAQKKYYELFRFSNTEVIRIDGGIGYGANFGQVEFDLYFAPTTITGSYINKTGNNNFGLYLYKNTDTEYIVYASGFDWALIRFNSTKSISGNVNVVDTPIGTLVKSLVTGNQTDSSVSKALTNIIKTKTYTNVSPSDTTNKFYEIPSELNGKQIVRISAPTNVTARLYGFSPMPRIRFFDYTNESSPITVNTYTVYYLE